MTVITVSRQFGSGGDEIAERICDLLGYRYFDKQLIIEAAADTGLSEQDIFELSEDRYEVRSFFTRLLQSTPAALVRHPLPNRDVAAALNLTTLDEEAAVRLVEQSVLHAYQRDNIVIVGRGGQAILKDKPTVLHVRVVAPMEDRIQRLRARGMTGIAAIKAKIRQQDQASTAYLQRFYKIRWDDPTLYHIVINTGKLAPEQAAQLVVDLAEQLRFARAA